MVDHSKQYRNEDEDWEQHTPHAQSNGTSAHFSFHNLPTTYLSWIEENGFDVICVCDKRGRLQYVTPSVHKLLGYNAVEMKGSRALTYLSPHDQEKLLQIFWKHPEQEATLELQVRQKNGKYIWVESKMSMLVQENGAQSILVVTRDISDRKEAEEMMIRSEKMSVAGQLAAGIAHEIRNPLTSIKGFLQLLQLGVEGKEGYYSIMNEEIEKMETITSELLFISKPMTNDIKSESLASMLEDVCTLLESQAKLQHIHLVLDCNQNYYVHCDRSQIKQVFINVIKNAVEVMEDGGQITIETRQIDSFYAIDVKDEGPGIPRHLINKITEPFFTTKKNGTGLGLMITKQILERHHGRLEIINNEPFGSIFRVLLPIQEMDA
ncbi:ATP-binding protein [Pontibacillus salicampi]|uniref:histidine kinase n=1 Tax=Pontibacillus salicampi TaxID=1449801 RepID=A0ABV6LRP0_9BACI